MKENKNEKRLKKLVQGKQLTKKLTYADLLLLLQSDQPLQAQIRELAKTPPEQLLSDSFEEEPEPNTAQEIPSAPEPEFKPRLPSAADLFYAEVASQRLFLHTVQEDQEIASLWLKPDESEAQALVRLLARASQWEQLEGLWDVFASRCKKQERALNTSENQLLQHSLDCYNLTLNSRQAELFWPDCPAAFDHEKHARGTPQGEKVTAVWLPGLTNAAGKIHKKPLVATA